jgi:membrane carboxypeptidase/penicillin-binding protein PbpC
VTVRQALANSYNIPAVKTLSQIGVANLVTFGQQMGITTWSDPSRFGLSLTLGGGEVKMLDMAELYGTFANNGFRVPLSPLMRVTDYTGTINDVYACSLLESRGVLNDHTDGRCGGTPVIDTFVAYAISDILSDNQARSAAFGSHSVLVIPHHQVAVKTGTTNDLRDNWTFGYTTDYLTATWVGNNDNTPMSRVVSGITGASPIWNTIMTNLLTGSPTQAFVPPKDMVQVWVCPLTQSLTCSACPAPRQEYFLPGTQPTHACTNESIQNALTPPVPDPNRDRLLDGAMITQ